MDRERTTIAALWAVFAMLVVAMLLACNVWWQWQHCGTPLARCAPAQVAPCERVADVEDEWKYLEQKTEKHPIKE